MTASLNEPFLSSCPPSADFLVIGQPHGSVFFLHLPSYPGGSFISICQHALTPGVLALAFVCLGLSGLRSPQGSQPAMAKCDSCLCEELRRITQGGCGCDHIFNIQMWGPPQKLCTRFSSEHGNLHPSSGYITDSGVRHMGCVQKTNSGSTMNGCMALRNLLNVSELLFPHL